MRILKITNELSRRYLQTRDSYESARQALLVSLPDIKEEELQTYYVNAFRDLCDVSVRLADVENEILETLGIKSFERIELENVFTMEEENDN